MQPHLLFVIALLGRFYPHFTDEKTRLRSICSVSKGLKGVRSWQIGLAAFPQSWALQSTRFNKPLPSKGLRALANVTGFQDGGF